MKIKVAHYQIPQYKTGIARAINECAGATEPEGDFEVSGARFNTLSAAESYAKTCSTMFSRSFEVRSGTDCLMQYIQGRKNWVRPKPAPVEIIPIADLYAELLAAVSRGDIAQAQTLAAQIAA